MLEMLVALLLDCQKLFSVSPKEMLGLWFLILSRIFIFYICISSFCLFRNVRLRDLAFTVRALCYFFWVPIILEIFSNSSLFSLSISVYLVSIIRSRLGLSEGMMGAGHYLMARIEWSDRTYLMRLLCCRSKEVIYCFSRWFLKTGCSIITNNYILNVKNSPRLCLGSGSAASAATVAARGTSSRSGLSLGLLLRSIFRRLLYLLIIASVKCTPSGIVYPLWLLSGHQLCALWWLVLCSPILISYKRYWFWACCLFRWFRQFSRPARTLLHSGSWWCSFGASTLIFSFYLDAI